MEKFKKFLAVMVMAGIAAVASVARAQLVLPTQTMGVTATLSGSSQIVVAWSAPASNQSMNIAGYYVYRNGALVANTPGVLNYTDTVSPGSYTYAVAAYSTSGTVYPQSAPSGSVTVTADAIPPTAPTGLTATSFTSSTITLSWSAATDNVGVVGYYLSRDGFRVLSNAAITGTSYTDTGLQSNTSYRYTLVAYDAAGNISPASNALNVGTLPPTFTVTRPFNVTALAVSTSEIDVAWGASVDASGSPISYYLSRDGVPFASTTAITYHDAGLKAGVAHWYTVIGFDALGNVSSPSDPASTSTLAAVATSAPAVEATAYGQLVTTPVPTQPTSNSAVVASSVAPTAVVTAVPASIASPATFTTLLYFGMRGDAVSALQMILVKQGYLSQKYVTGVFGALTQKALQRFQCDQNIVCSGSPWTTGWGLVGVKTRKVLNKN